MTKPLSNVDITVDTWGIMIAKTNVLIDALNNEIITANTSYANTGNNAVHINSQLFGVFSANTLVATDSLRGGNVSSSANLTISSNSTFSANVVVVGSTTLSNTLNTGNTTVTGTLTTTSNTNVSGSLNVTGTVNVSNTVSVGNTTFGSLYNVLVSSNSNIGNNSSTRLVYSFPKASYRTGKLIVSASNSGKNQIVEILVAHDGTTSYSTTYGTIASPVVVGLEAPLGTFTSQVNVANVEIYMAQVYSNTSVTVVAQLIV